jgi:hypothetical protein
MSNWLPLFKKLSPPQNLQVKRASISEMNMEFLGNSLISFGFCMVMCEMLFQNLGNYLMQFV